MFIEFHFNYSDFEIAAVMTAKCCSRVVAIEFLDRIKAKEKVNSLKEIVLV
jgi:hypothetical protein